LNAYPIGSFSLPIEGEGWGEGLLKNSKTYKLTNLKTYKLTNSRTYKLKNLLRYFFPK
jgi:hypothetical protein